MMKSSFILAIYGLLFLLQSNASAWNDSSPPKETDDINIACYSAYSYHSVSNITSSVQGLQKKQDIELSGTLYVKFLSTEIIDNKTYTKLLGVLKNVKTKTSGDDKDSVKTYIESVVTEPFLMTLDINNALIGVEVKPELRKYRASIVGLVQNIFVPNKADTVFELTAEGLAKVHYVKDPKNPLALLKSRIAIYDRDKKENASYRIPFSKYVLKADSNDCLKIGVHGNESYEITSTLDNSRANGKLEIKVVYDKKSTLLSKNILDKIDRNIDKWSLANKATAIKLSKDDLEKFGKQFSFNIVNLKKREEKLKLVNENLDYFLALNQLITNSFLDDKAVMEIMWALGVIDTPETVSILSHAVFSELNPNDRFRALRGLAMTKTSLTDTQLEQFLSYLDSSNRDDEVDNSAAMALGEFAYNRYQTDPEQTAKIGEEIANYIDNSITSGKADRIVIDAARNMRETAGDNVVDSVLRVLPSASFDMKATAAEALAQFSHRDSLQPIIKDYILQEKDAVTKARFIDAYTRHANNLPEYIPEMIKFVRNKAQHDEIRKAAVSGMLSTEYGKNDVEKQKLRDLMIAEKSSTIIKSISKRIYASSKTKDKF